MSLHFSGKTLCRNTIAPPCEIHAIELNTIGKNLSANPADNSIHL